MADKRISQLIERTDIANNDVLPIVASGATTTNKVTISTIQDWMQDNLDVGVTSVGITLGTSGTDVNVSGSPITTSGNITINIPDASASARGVVTTGSQNFAGNKSFQNTIFVNAGLRLDQNGTALPTFVQNISGTGLISSGSNGLGFNSANNLYFSGSEKGGAVLAVNNSAVRTYTLQDANGTLAFTSDLGGYVTLDTAQTITAQKTFTTSGSSDTMIISHGSGSGIALDVIKAGNGEAIRVQKTSGSGNAVTITGGTLSAEAGQFSGDLQSATRVIAAASSQSIILTPNSGGTTNRVESVGTLPLALVSAAAITMAAGGTTPQITLATTGDVTFTGSVISFNNTGYIRGDAAGWLSLQGGSNGFRVRNAGNSLSYLSIAEASGAATFSSNVIVGGGTTSTSKLTILATTGVAAPGSPTLGIYDASAPTFGFDFSLEGVATGDLYLNRLVSGTRTSVLQIARATGAATFSRSITVESSGIQATIHAKGGGDAAGQGKGNFRSSDFGGANYWDFGRDNLSTGNFVITSGGGSPLLSLASTGAATFSSSVTATANASGRSGLFGGASFGVRIDNSGSFNNGGSTIHGVDNTFVASYQKLSLNGSSLEFMTDYSPRVTITNAGNVGIGTASPSDTLHVVKNGAGSYTAALWTNTSSTANLYVGVGGSGVANTPLRNNAYVMNAAASDLILGTSDNERLRITSGGYLVLGGSSSVYGQAGRGTFEMNGSADNMIAMRVGGSLTGYLYTNASSMELYSTNPLILSTAGAERMRITSGGRVLIGSSTDKGSSAGTIQVSGGIHSSTGYYTTGISVTISALNTNYVLRASAYSGLIVLRDNLNGGSAVWLADPNQGYIQIANNMPGTWSMSYSGGNTFIQKTSGNTGVVLGVAFYSNEYFT